METATTETLLQILVVDDEENILRSLKRLLTNEEFNVLTAISGKEGLKTLHATPDIALIISDQRMPGLSGVEFLEQAKKLAPDASRIILTGYADVNAAIEGINKGEAYRYITKPWNDDELVRIVHEAVLKFGLIKDNQRLTRIVKKQNEELKKWNSGLESRVQEQTIEIQERNKELQALNERLKNNFKNSIAAFTSLLELRDKEMRNHSKNVAAISEMIAGSLELPKDETETVTVAALLHDIGLIGMSDAMLVKGLDIMLAEKQKEFLQHPVRGQAAIDSIEDLREAGILIRHHHENYDGTGFPDRLSGHKIPVGSKIIAVADFIETTMSNLYGKDSIKITLGKVKQELGRRFDPKLYRYLEAPVRELYNNIADKHDMVEKEFSIMDIQPGMVLSRDARSGTGLILLVKGVKLSEKNIRTLRRYHQLDPPETGIFVWRQS